MCLPTLLWSGGHPSRTHRRGRSPLGAGFVSEEVAGSLRTLPRIACRFRDRNDAANLDAPKPTPRNHRGTSTEPGSRGERSKRKIHTDGFSVRRKRWGSHSCLQQTQKTQHHENTTRAGIKNVTFWRREGASGVPCESNAGETTDGDIRIVAARRGSYRKLKHQARMASTPSAGCSSYHKDVFLRLHVSLQFFFCLRKVELGN